MATTSRERSSYRTLGGKDVPVFAEGEIIFCNTGYRLTDEAFNRHQAGQHETAQTSERIADLLEEAGIPARRSDRLVEVGIHSGEFREVVAYRPIQLIPAVAVRERAPEIANFTFFAEHELDPAWELWTGVITAGGRCPVEEIGLVLRHLHAKVAKWADAVRRRIEVDVLLRVTEFTRNDAGLYHLHIHAVVACPRGLPREGRVSVATLQALTGRMFGGTVLAFKLVDRVRPCARYLLKPPFSTGQLPATPAEAEALRKALVGVKLVQSLGSFRAFRRQLKDAGEKIVSKIENGSMALVRMTKPRRDRTRSATPLSSGGEDRRPNRVIGYTRPRPFATPRFEACLLVRNFDPETFKLPSWIGEVPLEALEHRWRSTAAPGESPRGGRSWHRAGALSAPAASSARGRPSDMVHISSSTIPAARSAPRPAPAARPGAAKLPNRNTARRTPAPPPSRPSGLAPPGGSTTCNSTSGDLPCPPS